MPADKRKPLVRTGGFCVRPLRSSASPAQGYTRDMEAKAKTSLGTILPIQAETEFLRFIDWYTELISDSPDDYHSIGYRMDTWQLWSKCIGHTPGDTLFQCQNPGLHVEIQAPSPKPFTVRLGAYTLFRERHIDDAFDRASNEAAFHVQMAMGHMHVFGQPHHADCVLCDDDPEGAPKPPPFDGDSD